MKTTDIPRFIKDGDKTMDLPIAEFVEWVERNEKDKAWPLIMNPDFQRSHVWTEEQQVAYVETLLQGGANHARTFYFNDASFCKKGYTDFVCVDGLQRYNAIRKFINRICFH